MATVRSTDALPTYAAADPAYTGVYLSSIVDDPGTVALRNHISLFNPSGSGKMFVILGAIVSCFSVNTVTAATSMAVYRSTASSGGTQITAANINKFSTAYPNSVADMRTGNPTVTLLNSQPLGSFPTVFGTGTQSAIVNQFSGASFSFLPGEGLVFQVSAGDVDIRWSAEMIWGERPL